MTAVPLGEQPSLCVLCSGLRANIARSGGCTCWSCHDRLTAMLSEIVTRYARLSARPQGGQDFGRRAPGFHSRPPVNIHIAALRDPRTSPLELGEPHAPLNLLLTWSRWVRQIRGQDRVRYPAELDDLAIIAVESTYLSTAMDWITRQPWVIDLHDQTRAVVAQLRSATGEPNPRPVGTCQVTDCGHPLFLPKAGLDMRCGGCGETYEPSDLIDIAIQADAGCRACGHTDSQHDNDTETRTCNYTWCSCTGWRPPQ